MIKINETTKTISISKPALFLKNPSMVFTIIEKAAITGYRLDAVTWDGIFDAVDVINTVPRSKIRFILNSIFKNGDIEYAIDLLTNSGIHKTLLGLEFYPINYGRVKDFDIDDINSVEDFYYFMSLGEESNYTKIIGSDKKTLKHIKAVNHIMDACRENSKIRFDNDKLIGLVKDAKLISKSATTSGFMFDEIKSTIKYYRL